MNKTFTYLAFEPVIISFRHAYMIWENYVGHCIFKKRIISCAKFPVPVNKDLLSWLPELTTAVSF